MEMGAPLLWQIINFLLLLALLSLFLYRPLNHLLEERQKEIEGSLKESREEREEATALKESYLEKMRGLEKKSQVFIQDMKEEGQRERERILAKAEIEAEALKERSAARLEEMKAQVREEIKEEMGDLAIEITSYLLQKSMDKDSQRSLVEELIESLEGADLK